MKLSKLGVVLFATAMAWGLPAMAETTFTLLMVPSSTSACTMQTGDNDLVLSVPPIPANVVVSNCADTNYVSGTTCYSAMTALLNSNSSGPARDVSQYFCGTTQTAGEDYTTVAQVTTSTVPDCYESDLGDGITYYFYKVSAAP